MLTLSPSSMPPHPSMAFFHHEKRTRFRKTQREKRAAKIKKGAKLLSSPAAIVATLATASANRAANAKARRRPFSAAVWFKDFYIIPPTAPARKYLFTRAGACEESFSPVMAAVNIDEGPLMFVCVFRFRLLGVSFI